MGRAIGTQVIALIVSVLLCLLAGVIGGIFTASAIPTWYATLQRPSFSPPNWVFAPVWTTLYVMMGIAAFLVWRQGADRAPVRTALVLFGVQLLLNVLWSPAFFGLRSPGAGLVVIILLWLALVATIVAFFRTSTPAGVLLIPYLMWVSFATVLNASILALNR